jgi:membrane protein DedA with SNARE-associated domain
LAGAAFTPIPYKISTIAAGATQMDFWMFSLVSLLGRGARFFLVGGLIYFVGPKIKVYIDKYFELITIGLLVLVVLGFVAIKYVF